MWRHAGNQSAESSDQQRETAKPLILIVLIGLESGGVIRMHYKVKLGTAGPTRQASAP